MQAHTSRRRPCRICTAVREKRRRFGRTGDRMYRTPIADIASTTLREALGETVLISANICRPQTRSSILPRPIQLIRRIFNTDAVLMPPPPRCGSGLRKGARDVERGFARPMTDRRSKILILNSPSAARKKAKGVALAPNSAGERIMTKWLLCASANGAKWRPVFERRLRSAGVIAN
jgi:hypothetical protein